MTPTLKRKYQYHEAKLQDSIVWLLDWVGLEHTVMDASRVWGPDGKPRKSKVDKNWPDILIVFGGGQAGFIETKSKRGRVSEGQAECHRRLQELGARVIVPRSLEEVYDWLDQSGPLLSKQRKRLEQFAITLPATSLEGSSKSRS